MKEKDSNDVNEIRNKAIKYYRSIKTIKCPAFSKEIRVSPDGLAHIEWKDAKHKRSYNEAYMRYLCFLSLEDLLSNMKIYQEYKADSEEIELKRNKKTIIEKKLVQYYGFVGIIEKNGTKHRIRVVVKEVYGWDKIDFVSVMPARKTKGHPNFFG